MPAPSPSLPAPAPQELQPRRDPRRERLAEHLLVGRHTQDAILDCINQREHLRDGQLCRLVKARKASLERVRDKLDRCPVELIAEHDDLAELANDRAACRLSVWFGNHPDRPVV